MNAPRSLIIVNGSPRGSNSVSLRFARYLATIAGARAVEIDAGKDGPNARRRAIDALYAARPEADLVVWTYPVYVCGPPAQMLQFMNDLAADPRATGLAGLPFIQVLTSKHFFDTTAMAALKAMAGDLGMADCGAYSGDPADLLQPAGQAQLQAFWRQASGEWLEATGRTETTDAQGLQVLVLTDQAVDDGLARGTAELSTALGLAGAMVEMAELAASDIRGGCLGCLRCVVANGCPQNDGFGRLMERVKAADAIVFSQRIVGRWFHPLWKRYDDRGFRFGHRLTLEGKPFLFLVGGDLAASPWLADLIEARTHIGGNPLAGVLSDPGNECGFEAAAIEKAARRLVRLCGGESYSPPSFWRAGGLRIFRDLVWEMRGLMRLDHAFYRKHGLYDFPQKRRWSTIKGYLSGALLSVPAIREKAMPKMIAALGAPYDKILAKEGMAVQPVDSASD